MAAVAGGEQGTTRMGLDAVELVMSVEETFGIDLPDADAAQLTTPRKLIDYVSTKVGATGEKCVSQRSFYRVRRILSSAANVSGRTIRPATYLETLLPLPERKRLWSRVAREIGVRRTLTRPRWLLHGVFVASGVGGIAGGSAVPGHPFLAAAGAALGLAAVLAIMTQPAAVRLDVTAGALALEAIPAVLAADAAAGPVKWTRDAVAETCRVLIREQVRVNDFSDDAEFIRDLGMG